MPNFSTPSGSTIAHIPVLAPAQLDRVPALMQFVANQAGLEALVIEERRKMAMGLPCFVHGQEIRNTSEPLGVVHYWHRDTTGSTDAARAALSHARFARIGNVATELFDDATLIHDGTGTPSPSAGAREDIFNDKLTGNVYRKGGSGWTIAMSGQGARYLPVTPPPQIGGEMPTIEQTFTDYITGKTPTHTYSFGSAATALNGTVKNVAITNLTQLGTHFDAWSKRTNRIKINGELQAYMAFKDSTHEMMTDRLNMWARLIGGEWPVYYNSQIDNTKSWKLDGTATPWANIPTDPEFNLAQGMAVAKVGQFVAGLNKGIAHIAAITPGTTFTLAPMGGTDTAPWVQTLVALLPIHSTVCTTHSGLELTFPPGELATDIEVGYIIGRQSGNEMCQVTNDPRVAAIDHAAGTVTLTEPYTALGLAGARVVFHPAIEAGQIWSKDEWDITNKAGRLIVEWDIDHFTGLNEAADPYVSGASRWDFLGRLTQHPETPYGTCDACWGYSGTSFGNGFSTGTPGIFEPDPMEIFNGMTSGMKLFSTGARGDIGDPTYMKTTDGYTATNVDKNRVPFSVAGPRKVRWVYCYDTAADKNYNFHYLDETLLKVQEWRWGSPFALQLATNMSMGWISKSFSQNFMFPMMPSSFNRANIALKNLRVWHRAGAAT